MRRGDGGTSSAEFTSEAYQLVEDKNYVAYYPILDWATASPQIPVSYEGQTQTGDNSTAHLGAYDFLVSDKVTPSATNTAAFTFSHLGAAVRLQITLKNVEEYDLIVSTKVPWSEVILSTSDGSKAFITKGTLDLFGDNEFTTTETASSVTLGLSGIESGAEEHTINVWLMLAPTDLSGKTINVSMHAHTCETYPTGRYLESDDCYLLYRDYQTWSKGTFSIDGKNFKAGYTYSLPVVIDKWQTYPTDEITDEL